jgi:dihydroflavonol-4-reductase
MSGCSAVFHVAADYRLWSPDPGEIYRNNVTGTENVLEAALGTGVDRVVHTSSVGALGHTPDGSPANEDTPVSLDRMIGHYKRSKFLAERKAEEFAARGLHVVIVNPSTPIGPGDHKPTPTGKIVADYLNRKMIAYVDTGLNLVHVEDVAAGHLLALEKGVPGRKYILGNTDITLAGIFEILERLSGIPAPRVRLPRSFVVAVAYVCEKISAVTGHEPLVPLEGVKMAKRYMFFDPSRAVRELGLPTTPVETALSDAVDWYVANGYVKKPLPARPARTI